MMKGSNMEHFEKGVKLSFDKWIDSIPDNVPPYEHSGAYLKKIERLKDKMRGDKYHYFTRAEERLIFALSAVPFGSAGLWILIKILRK